MRENEFSLRLEEQRNESSHQFSEIKYSNS